MEKIRIQDDLYTYVNQETLDQLVIPDDQPATGGFSTLALSVEKLMINEFNEMCDSNNYPNSYLENACKLFKIAKNAEKKVVDSIRVKANRPTENGSEGGSGILLSGNASKLTKKERADLARRAAKGERITF